jgi:hypothetical protein
MFLVTRVYCNDEWAETPDAFVLEFDKQDLEWFAKKAKAVSRMRDVKSAIFDANGEWIDSETLAEALGDEDIVFLDELPGDRKEEDHICGHEVHIYPDGDLIFEAYRKNSPWTFQTPLISIKDLRRALEKTPIGDAC